MHLFLLATFPPELPISQRPQKGFGADQAPSRTGEALREPFWPPGKCGRAGVAREEGGAGAMASGGRHLRPLPTGSAPWPQEGLTQQADGPSRRGVGIREEKP